MPKKSKSAKGRQSEYRRATFNSSQYWNINYTEKHSSGLEKDFKTIVSAKSYELAIHILKSKLMEDNPSIKIKAVQGFMLHKTYHSSSSGRLGVKEWEQIRKSSFPNENNFLFKSEFPRAKWKTNRFNKTDFARLKSIGFSKGESNWATRNRKGKTLSMEERSHKIFKGHWIDWDPSLRQAAKNKLIESLIKSGNSRSKSAELLGISRNSIYKLFRKFPETDWKSEYPPPASRRPLSPPKKYSSMNPAELDELSLKLDSVLEQTGGSRTKSAKLLHVSQSVFNRQLKLTNGIINWSKKYPSKFANKKHEN